MLYSSSYLIGFFILDNLYEGNYFNFFGQSSSVLALPLIDNQYPIYVQRKYYHGIFTYLRTEYRDASL